MRLSAILLSAALAVLAATPAGAGDPEVETGEVTARVLRAFRIGSSETRFGAFEFVGGLELTSGLSHLGALSGFRFIDGGTSFIGVTDTGFWYRGAVERDAEAKPSGISRFEMHPIPDTDGVYSNNKGETDAEGLTVGPDGSLTVSFERRHRISEYGAPGSGLSPAFRGNLDFIVPERELRNNRGFETIAYSAPDGPLAGARVAVSEKSIDKAGNIFAAVLEGPRKGVFKVARSDKFDITDGDFLPDGDLLILERRFSMADSIGMRIRRIPGAAIEAGATVDGAIVLEADFSYQIDNMEALDIWRSAAGETMVSLVSDDNRSLLQRTLYLEFRLVE